MSNFMLINPMLVAGTKYEDMSYINMVGDTESPFMFGGESITSDRMPNDRVFIAVPIP